MLEGLGNRQFAQPAIYKHLERVQRVINTDDYFRTIEELTSKLSTKKYYAFRSFNEICEVSNKQQS